MIFFLRAPNQPPSGGCVLKPRYATQGTDAHGPAAFGRLCVETIAARTLAWRSNQPPSGGCVLKHKTPLGVRMRYFPAAFGRLCVETANEFGFDLIQCPAAFGRLCVET